MDPLKENGPFEYIAYLYLQRENGPFKENGPSCFAFVFYILEKMTPQSLKKMDPWKKMAPLNIWLTLTY